MTSYRLIYDLTGHANPTDLLTKADGDILYGDAGVVSSRTALAAITAPTNGQMAYLTELGREGRFTFRTGNYTGDVSNDTQQGLFVAPASSPTGAAGAWVRQLTTPWALATYFGTIDCTGSPKLSNEVVYDNITQLRGMWSIVKYLAFNRNIILGMDWSMLLGGGISEQWDISTGQDGAWWNSIIFPYRAGRLVAMAYMDSLIRMDQRSFRPEGGRMQLWGGTDTQLNSGNFGLRYAKNGLTYLDVGGSTFGDGEVQGVRRYGVLADKNAGGLPNNNINAVFGDWKFVQCGCRTSDTVKHAGTYVNGAWQNLPAQNNSNFQRHRIDLPVAVGLDYTDYEIGDGLSCNGDTEFTTIQGIIGWNAGTRLLTVDVYPVLSAEVTGSFQATFGGMVSDVGGNSAGTEFRSMNGISLGTGVELASEYGLTCNNIIIESALNPVKCGLTGLESMEGVKLKGHVENCTWLMIDYATMSACEFDFTSNMEGTNRGKFDKIKRLVPHSATGHLGVFTASPPGTIRGASIKVNGGVVQSPVEITRQIGLFGGTTIGNMPEYQGVGALFNCDSWAWSVLIDKSLADAMSTGKVAHFGPIAGNGPGGAPTSNITFAVSGSQYGALTIEGGATYTIPPGIGAIEGEVIYCPNAADSGDCLIRYWRSAHDAPGMGGTAAQITSKSTGVTLSKVSGQITMHNAGLAAGASVSFVLTNTTILATDVIFAVIGGGAADPAAYTIRAAVAAGSAKFTLKNDSAGLLSEAVVVNFKVMRNAIA
jgi:hypothetical protein